MACAAIVASMIAIVPANAQNSGLKLSLGANFSTGDYGTGQDVDILSLPLTAEYETERWNFGLTVPFISITSVGDVVGGTAGPIVTNKKKSNAGGTVERTTERGLGDIVASLGYAMLPGNEGAPFVELSLKIKFPTASESKSLGTGEFDYTAMVNVSKTYGQFTPFANIGYSVIGEPSGTDLDNIILLSAGAGYAFTDRLSAGVALDYRQATTSTADASVELSPYVTWGLAGGDALDFYALVGLSDGSPDIGGGLAFTYAF